MKKGFTLVELAIVLVIVGLLIGGILIAQSMIKTSQIQSFIRQVQQFDVAVENFRQQFRGLPGDTTIMGCTSYGSNTCRNGVIEDAGANGFGSASYFDGEEANFWTDLQKSGFMSNGPTFSSTIASSFTVNGTTVHSPKMPLGKNTGVQIFFATVTSVPQRNYYKFGDYASTNSGDLTLAPATTLTEAEALAIDTKLDDGVYTAWNIDPPDKVVPDCPGNVFDLSISGPVCALMIRVLSSTGTQ